MSFWVCGGLGPGRTCWWVGKIRQDLPRSSDACPTCLLLWEYWAEDKGRAMGAIFHEPLRSGTWFPLVSLLAEWGHVARRRKEEGGWKPEWQEGCKGVSVMPSSRWQ